MALRFPVDSYNPVMRGEGGGPVGGAVVFCSLFKRSKGNPDLKIFDVSQLFLVDAPVKKNIQIANALEG